MGECRPIYSTTNSPNRLTYCYISCFCRDADSWFCVCRPGYTGSLCERTVCHASPCQHGATCIHLVTQGTYVCVCPYGRHGSTCSQGDSIYIVIPLAGVNRLDRKRNTYKRGGVGTEACIVGNILRVGLDTLSE